MRISYASDIHLEFGKINLKNKDNADLLILAGDVCVAQDFVDKKDRTRSACYAKFFKQISKEFPETIYIKGNHEHYHGDFQTTHSIIKNHLSKFPNIYFLEKESFEYKNVLFLATTLWTDMDHHNPDVEAAIKYDMNDFRVVTNGEMTDEEFQSSQVWNPYSYSPKSDRMKKFTPYDAAEEHKLCLNFIDTAYELGTIFYPTIKDVVVVTHHAPTFTSVHPKYQMHKEDKIMTFGYASNLENFILTHPNIKYWFHGHVHTPFHYMIGQCQVLCNPRGYINREQIANDFKLRTIEI